MKRIDQWKNKMKKLAYKRESNVSRYILPIEIQMEQLRDKIREQDPDYNEF